MADGAFRRFGRGHFRWRQPRRQFRVAQSRQHLLDQAVQRLFQSRFGGRALSRVRDLVGQSRAFERRRDAVDRRQFLRRQQALDWRTAHLRWRAHRSAQHQVADCRLLFVGRQHHPAAAGVRLDTRPLRRCERDRRQRPDHRLFAASQHRPSWDLRFGQGRRQRAPRIRLLHGDDRGDAARPLRGGHQRRGEDTANRDLVDGKYLFRLERRTLDDIRAFGVNSPEDDKRFAAVARLSEVNLSLYRTFAEPWVRAAVTPSLAEAIREWHPHRLRFRVFSDRNPLMAPVKALAAEVRANRKPVSADNPFLALEKTGSELITTSLRSLGETRDALTEANFLNAYGSPL